MSAEAVAVLWAVGMLIAWSGVCWAAGAIWEHRRAVREDYNARDMWATEMEKRA